jgi:hypothetical protein
LGLSVLIGVFASQLAGETWDTVLEEVEAEKREKEGTEEQDDDGIVRSVLNMDLPDWLVGFQIALAMADDRIHQLIYDEYDAKVWNVTKDERIPPELDPALSRTSPEVVGANKGFDFGASICDGLVLSPALFQAYLMYGDPLLDEEKEKAERNKPRDFLMDGDSSGTTSSIVMVSSEPQASSQEQPAVMVSSEPQTSSQEQPAADSEAALLNKLDALREITRERLNKLNAKIRDEEEIY